MHLVQALVKGTGEPRASLVFVQKNRVGGSMLMLDFVSTWSGKLPLLQERFLLFAGQEAEGD